MDAYLDQWNARHAALVARLEAIEAAIGPEAIAAAAKKMADAAAKLQADATRRATTLHASRMPIDPGLPIGPETEASMADDEARAKAASKPATPGPSPKAA